MKSNSHFRQNVYKQSTANYAHLSPQINVACAAWCGIGRQELRGRSMDKTEIHNEDEE